MLHNSQITPTQQHESTGTTNLFLIAQNAKRQQAEDKAREEKNRLYKLTDDSFKEIEQFILQESFDSKMLEAAQEGKTTWQLVSIPVSDKWSYDNAHVLCDTLIARIQERPDLLNKISKDNKWINSEGYPARHVNGFSGEISYIGSMKIFIDFSPKPEPTPNPKADKPATTRWTCNLL